MLTIQLIKPLPEILNNDIQEQVIEIELANLREPLLMPFPIDSLKKSSNRKKRNRASLLLLFWSSVKCQSLNKKSLLTTKLKASWRRHWLSRTARSANSIKAIRIPSREVRTSIHRSRGDISSSTRNCALSRITSSIYTKTKGSAPDPTLAPTSWFTEETRSTSAFRATPAFLKRNKRRRKIIKATTARIRKFNA